MADTAAPGHAERISFGTDGTRRTDQAPPADSWRISRPWLSVLVALLAGVQLVPVVIGLATGETATANDRGFPWWQALLGLGFLTLMVGEFRRRVAVDHRGIHVIDGFRRRTYPWQDVSELHPGRPILLGDAYVYLLRHEAEQVELPMSRAHLDLLRRWHAASRAGDHLPE